MKKISKQWILKEQQDKHRTKYPQSTDSDMQLEQEQGKEESMLRMLKNKLHLTKPEMRLIIDDL